MVANKCAKVTVMDKKEACLEIGSADLSVRHGRGHGHANGGSRLLRTCSSAAPAPAKPRGGAGRVLASFSCDGFIFERIGGHI